MEMNDEQIQRRLRDRFPLYAATCLKIRTKNGSIIPFELNKAQEYIHQKLEEQLKNSGKVRAVILKGRQQGCSTYIEGRFFHKVTLASGKRAFILTHHSDATKNLFEMADRFYQHCPIPMKPSIDKSNEKELYFGRIDSGYKVGTAATSGVGRSATIQYFHGSEVAFWPNASEHATGILQAISNEADTEIILESTANGIGNYFHDQWMMAESGQSDFIPIFVPWFWQPEYTRPLESNFSLTNEEDELQVLYGLTDEQLNWRRHKIIELSSNGTNGLKAFQREYPCTPLEAFQSSGENVLFEANEIIDASQQNLDRTGPLIIGVDPAAEGKDSTAIIKRQGRVAFDLIRTQTKDTMAIVGMIYQMVQESKPFRVCIDVNGLGIGIYDRCKELINNEILIPVNSASSPFNKEKYPNKRCEMWGLLREWFRDSPVQIPKEDILHSELCSIHYKPDSKNRLVIEKKEETKKRIHRSPDCADALVLTFAYPFEDIFKRTMFKDRGRSTKITLKDKRVKQARLKRNQGSMAW